MVDSTVSCLKELKEDCKTSTRFKDRTCVFNELMGEDWEIQKVIKNALTGKFIALASMQGDESFKSFSNLNVSNISSAFSLFDSYLFPSLEDRLQEYGKDNLQTLISFYGSEQQVAFEGKTWVSTLDIDRQGTELESKEIWSMQFSEFGLCYVPKASDSTIDDLQEVICLQTVLWIQTFQTLLLI